MTARFDSGTESQGFALEAIYQICPELESCDDATVTITLQQLETVLRAVGWKPPSEQQTEPLMIHDPEIPVTRSLLAAACDALRRYAIPAGADDQVVLNIEAACGIAHPPAPPQEQQAASPDRALLREAYGQIRHLLNDLTRLDVVDGLPRYRASNDLLFSNFINALIRLAPRMWATLATPPQEPQAPAHGASLVQGYGDEDVYEWHMAAKTTAPAPSVEAQVNKLREAATVLLKLHDARVDIDDAWTTAMEDMRAALKEPRR